MYKKFYGLKDKPFHLIPNPQFLYPSKKHQNALTYLEYGLSEGSGFILLTGDIGSGKTTIIRHILNRIDTEIEVGLISNTNVDSGELIDLVLHEFGVEQTFDNKAKALEAVFQYLIDKYAQGRRVLLVIDEAQNLSIQSLEEVRMLSNLQTDEHMLVQIVLVGQPELRRKLQLPELSQLSQRIAVYYHLGALEREELPEYIAYRLEKVGGSIDIFDPQTFDQIFEASGGIPRVINLLCDTALVYGYAESLPKIGTEVIAQVIRDKDGFGLITNDSIKNGGPREIGDDQALGTFASRILELEEKLAGLHRQVEQQAQERLVTELTALLRQEREKNDQLLFHCALMKNRLDVQTSRTDANAGEINGYSTGVGRGTRSLQEMEPGKQTIWSSFEQSDVDTFNRISSPEISMIDIHCHILPDIDDGASSFDEAIAMAKIAAADGIAAIVATPHLNDTLYNPVEISRRVSWLNHLLRLENIPVTVMPGCEVSVLFDAEQAKGFTLNDTSYILLEFQRTHISRNVGDILNQFVNKGFKPIVTHPERNPSVVANPNILLDALKEREHCYVQITAGSLTGEFGREVQQCSHHLLRSGVVDVIATDAHSSTNRKPMLSNGVKAAAEIVGAEAAQRMVFGTPAKIISGLAI